MFNQYDFNLISNQIKSKKYCIHNRRKSQCKECGGSQICIHNRRKSRCKECGGGSICIHQIERTNCKICKKSNKYLNFFSMK